jgi:hypothetical protein
LGVEGSDAVEGEAQLVGVDGGDGVGEFGLRGGFMKGVSEPAGVIGAEITSPDGIDAEEGEIETFEAHAAVPRSVIST